MLQNNIIIKLTHKKFTEGKKKKSNSFYGPYKVHGAPVCNTNVWCELKGRMHKQGTNTRQFRAMVKNSTSLYASVSKQF